MVIASACDHYTRVVQGGTLQARDSTIVGALFGTRTSSSGSGTVLSINDTTDVLTELSSQGIEKVTESEIQKKVRLWTAVYTQYELLGWYTFSDKVTPAHVALHDSITPFCKASPVFLLFQTTVSKAEIDKIPLNTFMLENIQGSRVFVETPFRTVSYEVEKIAVNQITNAIPRHGLSQLEVQNQSLHTSLKILDSKVATMMQVLEQMKDGKLKMDHSLLRSAQKICSALQANVTDEDVQTEIDKQLSDSLMITYLSAVQKSNRDWKEIYEVHERTYDRHNK